MDAKIVISITIGIAATILVYFGLDGSLELPTLNRLPIAANTAISIVIKQKNQSQFSHSDFSASYVYIKGNGSYFEAIPNSSHLGKLIGIAEPTVTGGNYYAWKLKNNKDGSTYFIEHIDGEIVSKIK